jgi:predicted HD phosphohydrolase
MTSYTRTRRTMTDEQLAADYAANRDTMATAMRGGVCTATVLAAVRKHGLGHLIQPRGKATVGRLPVVGLPADEIVRRYRAGQSGPLIAAAAGCPVGTIYRILDHNKVPRRACGPAARRTRQQRKQGNDDG